MHVFESVCMRKFRDEIILRGESIKPVKILNLNFSKKKGQNGNLPE